MENLNIVEALTQIAREKSVDRNLVIQTLSEALISAAKKRYGNADNFAVDIDANTGRMAVVASKTVVEEVLDPTTQITLQDALQIDEHAQLGGVVAEQLNFSEFGRNAIQTAKQVLIQRMREAERERVHEAFAPRVGQIESGVVQQISHGDIILNLGKAEAAIPLKEQIRRERYRQGDTVRGYIFEVLKVSKGPQILLSRTHPEFLKKLFSIEVPEISDGIVKIHAVAREPGERAKIAVSSNDDRVDPVGACVGVKGSRVQAIVRELSGERIDIVPWSEEASVFISRALSPAAVSRVILDHRRKHATAIVEDGQLSLAIGKSGQNSRLAVQLTGWGLDIITHDKYQERHSQIDGYQQELRRVPGVSELIALSLVTSGFTTIASVVEATAELLRTVPGLEGAAASQVKEAAQNYLAEHPEKELTPEMDGGAGANTDAVETAPEDLGEESAPKAGQAEKDLAPETEGTSGVNAGTAAAASDDSAPGTEG